MTQPRDAQEQLSSPASETERAWVPHTSACMRAGIEKAAKFVRNYIGGDSGWVKERELLEDLADAILEIGKE